MATYLGFLLQRSMVFWLAFCTFIEKSAFGLGLAMGALLLDRLLALVVHSTLCFHLCLLSSYCMKWSHPSPKPVPGDLSLSRFVERLAPSFRLATLVFRRSFC